MAKPVLRKPKRKASPLKSVKIKNIDYKDTVTLHKFVSDRGKIRACRITSTTAQKQRKIAHTVKDAHEMTLLPHSGSTH